MFIKKPNLPTERVRCVLIDYRAEKTKKILESMGIEVIATPNADVAYSEISGHADIGFHQINERCAVVAPQTYDYYRGIFSEKYIVCGAYAIGRTYPEDTAYNIARISGYAIHNFNFSDKKILEYYKTNGVKLINVKQGYSKCSVCVVGENALITEDKVIAEKAEANGIHVLLILPGGVKLKNFPYGFIGGATGLISPEILFFNGCVQKHPEYLKIKSFCAEHGVDIMSVDDYPLEDIGSIIPIM